MNNPTTPVPLPTTGTETLNGTAPAAASVELLQRMVHGAHDTLDRLAETAAPQLQRLEAGLTDANAALHDKADQVRQGGDAWAESLRCAVRDHPLAAVAAALAVGALVARITR